MIKSVTILRISGTVLSTAFTELLIKLSLGTDITYADAATIQKITPDVANKIVEIPLCQNLVIPLEVQVTTTQGNFHLINDDDFKWFLEYLEVGRIPERRFYHELVSRNRKLVAYMLGARKVLDMRASKT